MPSYGLFIHSLLVNKIFKDIPHEKLEEAQKFLDDIVKIAREREITMDVVGIASILFLNFLEKIYFEEVAEKEGLQDKVVVKKGDEVLLEFSLKDKFTSEIYHKISEKLDTLSDKEARSCEIYIDGKLDKYWTLLIRFRKIIDLPDIFKNYFYPILFVDIKQTLEVNDKPFMKAIVFFFAELIKSGMFTNFERVFLTHVLLDTSLNILVNSLPEEMYNLMIKDIKEREEII